MTIWSAPVRYAEVDQQGVVFNSHYLVWCDEALAAFCAERGLQTFAEAVHLKASSLVWSAPARWGQRVEVTVRCHSVGRTSTTLAFEIAADGEPCCHVETVYVLAADGLPQVIDDATRAALTVGYAGNG
ncbi:acyl-CoA thioesterase [uncultured Jatrophihabitans sp.]|uniref:acyl-CoA thioesterase n=1 Tax=uncultured Jatrophihabitans sp. TaxID=1610747 RepID=UPI0035CB5070